jgi:hypothetical protein
MTENKLTIEENFPIASLAETEVRIIDLVQYQIETTEWKLSLFESSTSKKVLIVPIQSRAKECQDWILNLAELQKIEDEEESPWQWDKNPPLLYGPEKNNGISIFFLVNGSHRVRARLVNGYDTYPLVEVRPGNFPDALKEACGPVNKGSALPERERARADKSKAVLMLIQCSDWWVKADQRIADHCNVSRQHVSNMRSRYIKFLDDSEWLASNGLRPIDDPVKKKQALESLYQKMELEGENGEATTRKRRDSKVSRELQGQTPPTPASHTSLFKIVPDTLDGTGSGIVIDDPITTSLISEKIQSSGKTSVNEYILWLIKSHDDLILQNNLLSRREAA